MSDDTKYKRVDPPERDDVRHDLANLRKDPDGALRAYCIETQEFWDVKRAPSVPVPGEGKGVPPVTVLDGLDVSGWINTAGRTLNSEESRAMAHIATGVRRLLTAHHADGHEGSWGQADTMNVIGDAIMSGWVQAGRRLGEIPWQVSGIQLLSRKTSELDRVEITISRDADMGPYTVRTKVGEQAPGTRTVRRAETIDPTAGIE